MKKIIFFLIVILSVFLFGCVNNSKNNEQIESNDIVIAKLINFTEPNLMDSSGLFEGTLLLQNTKDDSKSYSILICAENWIYKKNNCYTFSPQNIKTRIEALKKVGHLNGCFEGYLETVKCE